MHRVLAYAVRKKRLDKNPLSKGNLPEGWTPLAMPLPHLQAIQPVQAPLLTPPLGQR
jgi:hypothetical protein